MPPNGDAVIVPAGNTGLANYPNARLVPTDRTRTLYISGTSCRQPDGSFVGAIDHANGHQTFDIRGQTLATLRNIEATIKHASDGRGGLENVVDATVFLVDIGNYYAGMNAVWNEIYPDAVSAPARTAIEVSALPSPKMIVEMKCTAVITVQQ